MLVRVVTGPGACVGSIWYRFPGLVRPVTNTFPMANQRSKGIVLAPANHQQACRCLRALARPYR